MKSPDILAVLFYLGLSLRIITWFEYPYVLISGDLRPPLVPQAFQTKVLYSWNEVDFGMPSVYLPRILDPFYLLTSLFQLMGLDLFYSEMLTLFVMTFAASVLAYFYFKHLTGGNTVASFIAGVFLVTNAYMITDTVVTAVSFIDTSLVILPSLLALTAAIRRRSLGMVVVSGMLMTLTFDTFPNYRTTLLCVLAMIVTVLFLYVKDGVIVGRGEPGRSKYLSLNFDLRLLRKYVEYVLLLVASATLSSIWIIMILVPNLGSFLSSARAISPMPFVLALNLYDVIRLIAKWGFYSGSLGFPYVPYSNVYLHSPLVVAATYAIPLLAFSALLLHKGRKAKYFFALAALVFIVLTSGFNPFFPMLYYYVSTYLPLMAVFRESSNWVFLLVLAYCVLIGLAMSGIWNRLRRRSTQILAISLVIGLIFAASYPLITGDVTKNWLDPSIKGSSLPPSYVDLNSALSNQQWTLLLPPRGTYVVYNFTEGPLNSGNPYPLIFSKPVITGLGTEYLQSGNLDLIEWLDNLFWNSSQTGGASRFLGVLGIGSVAVEKDMISGGSGSLDSLLINDTPGLQLTKDFSEVQLYSNLNVLQKIYAADDVIGYSTLGNMSAIVSSLDWGKLSQSVFSNETVSVPSGGMSLPTNLTWDEVSPVSYKAHLTATEPFVLVLLEAFNAHWKVYVNGAPVPDAQHYMVNSYANGWLIDAKGSVSVTIEYDVQSTVLPSVLASVLFPMLLLLAVQYIPRRARTAR